jgi:tetratricopeptide (TPR) repeat protein
VSERDQHPHPDVADPIEQPEPHLEGLDTLFLSGVEHFRQGRIDRATEAFRGVLAVEPRLAEPRMELARILLDTGRLHEAEAEAREALGVLEAGGQWLEALEEPVVLGLAHGLLAEILRQIADTDEVIFGEPERFHAITRQAREHFAKAATLDPENQHASYHAFFMKLELPEGDLSGSVPVSPPTEGQGS